MTLPWPQFRDGCSRCLLSTGRNVTLPDRIVGREPGGARFAYRCSRGHEWECSWADYEGVTALRVVPAEPLASAPIEGEDAS